MKKTLLFLAALLISFGVSVAKTTYTYSLVITQGLPSNDKPYVYPNKNNVYYYEIELNPAPPNGSFAIGNFTVTIENGTIQNVSNPVPENTEFSVMFNDVPNQQGSVKISAATPTDTSAVILKTGSVTGYSCPIASLKDQIPNLIVSDFPPMGSKQVITAQVDDVIYPGISVSNGLGGITNLKAENYQWTLPPNWTASGHNGTTFYTGSNEKKITITPDNITGGDIKVQAFNYYLSAGSETKSCNMGRVLSFITYPPSIAYGDNTPRTFSVTAFAGVTYEWSSPSGWQINGQGNTLEGLNLNSVNITPSICSFDTIKVRVKKDGDISQWYNFPTQITNTPSISCSSSTVTQFDPLTFTLNNIDPNNIQSVTFSNNVYKSGNQGLDYNVALVAAGNIEVDISVLLKGCSTPITFKKQFTVSPSLITITGPNTVCCVGNSTFTLENPPPVPVYWTVSNPSIFTVTPSGNSASVIQTGIGGGGTLSARIGSSSGLVVATKMFSSCTSMPITFRDQTINTSQSVECCNDITVRNVIINADFVIRSIGVITIGNDVIIGSNGALLLNAMNNGQVVFDDMFDIGAGRVEIW